MPRCVSPSEPRSDGCTHDGPQRCPTSAQIISPENAQACFCGSPSPSLTVPLACSALRGQAGQHRRGLPGQQGGVAERGAHPAGGGQRSLLLEPMTPVPMHASPPRAWCGMQTRRSGMWGSAWRWPPCGAASAAGCACSPRTATASEVWPALWQLLQRALSCARSMHDGQRCPFECVMLLAPPA